MYVSSDFLIKCLFLMEETFTNKPKAVKRKSQQSKLDFFSGSLPPLCQNKEVSETFTKRQCDSNTDSIRITNDQLDTVVGENSSKQVEHCSQTGHVPGPGVSPLDISGVLSTGSTISDFEKLKFLENCWKLAPFDTLYSQCFGEKKHVVFQAKWLEERKGIYHTYIACKCCNMN
jgi:hypothetical protein